MTGLLVIGSGPAGVSAAETFRQHDPDASITILTTDTEFPYARPPLSKEYLRGRSDDIALHPPQWYDERAIDLQFAVTVDEIDVAQQTVAAGGRQFGYGALVLACGASPSALPVPGGERTLPLRSFTDAAALRKAAFRAGTAVVIGAGFIGCEAAASLAAHGISVSLVAPESAPQIDRLGAEAGNRLLALLETADVHFFGGLEVAAINGESVELNNGTSINADLILAATGVTPNSDVAAAAGLDIRDSRVVVGSDMRTSTPNIYAAGDVALAYNKTAGRHVAVEHWQDAVDQGAVAGAVAAGVTASWDSVPGFWSTIGDATVKHHAWGDGYQQVRVVDHADGFTIWYTAGAPEDIVVGVLTHNRDEDYDAGERLIQQRLPMPGRVR